ncbi:hypothetical protein GCM10007932_45620 [Vibrio penaeicida]|uniref:Uncharacterized protein n=1 Tax=Vibrio penaeicida TaxID=104609 RepID=A0AAV5NXN2_9VIBR|nr:hypothetical protein GCM10007932_45620 [Vibrio penaeicida]
MYLNQIGLYCILYNYNFMYLKINFFKVYLNKDFSGLDVFLCHFLRFISKIAKENK